MYYNEEILNTVNDLFADDFDFFKFKKFTNMKEFSNFTINDINYNNKDILKSLKDQNIMSNKYIQSVPSEIMEQIIILKKKYGRKNYAEIVKHLKMHPNF